VRGSVDRAPKWRSWPKHDTDYGREHDYDTQEHQRPPVCPASGAHGSSPFRSQSDVC
jgi:hypothetical protein